MMRRLAMAALACIVLVAWASANAADSLKTELQLITKEELVKIL